MAATPSIIKKTWPVVAGTGPWKTLDPFLFCDHAFDEYPKGTPDLGPDPKLLRGRNIGADFSRKDGWTMYHGETVPGFPVHPHRGFETITVTRQGLVDHFDSMGSSCRYGGGDTQWMTAGKGIQHCEMFPLLNQDGPNPSEMFQIWINLPKKSKFVEPAYKMIWAEDTPILTMPDGKSTIRIIAGNPAYFTSLAPNLQVVSPPPDSYASQQDSDVAIWEITLPADGVVEVPKTIVPDINRVLYFFDGVNAAINGTPVKGNTAYEVNPNSAVQVSGTGSGRSQFLLLQGKPIGEPVIQQGPFTMNTQEEIAQAYADYRRTQFGGWPWDRPDPTNGPNPERFAKLADGRLEKPKTAKP